MGPQMTQPACNSDARLAKSKPDGWVTHSQPDGPAAQSRTDGAASSDLTTDISDANIMRGMAMRPVNPLKVTSVVGQGPDIDIDIDGEFVVTHISNHRGKSSADQTVNDHRGSQNDHRLEDRRGTDDSINRRGQSQID